VAHSFASEQLAPRLHRSQVVAIQPVHLKRSGPAAAVSPTRHNSESWPKAAVTSGRTTLSDMWSLWVRTVRVITLLGSLCFERQLAIARDRERHALFLLGGGSQLAFKAKGTAAPQGYVKIALCNTS
jgi:hypothetical protein